MHSVKARLHMHNHNEPNGRAFIIGEKAALKSLGDALIAASKSVIGLEKVQLYTSDGHAYEILIACDITEDEWQATPVPYDKKHDPNNLGIIQTYNQLTNSSQ